MDILHESLGINITLYKLPCLIHFSLSTSSFEKKAMPHLYLYIHFSFYSTFSKFVLKKLSDFFHFPFPLLPTSDVPVQRRVIHSWQKHDYITWFVPCQCVLYFWCTVVKSPSVFQFRIPLKSIWSPLVTSYALVHITRWLLSAIIWMKSQRTELMGIWPTWMA